MKMKLAILGTNSHIARNLIERFAAEQETELHLFTRNASAVSPALRKKGILHEGYDDFPSLRYDVVINAIGAGTPDRLSPADWFLLPEKFDNLILDSLRSINPEALYLSFSSGAVYGIHSEPVDSHTCFSTPVNAVPQADRYSIMRLYTETKHRFLKHLNIVDLRIFSFFSRYANPDSGYFMTDVLKALIEDKPLKTNDSDMIRDYIAPDDLYSLIGLCIREKRINAAMDVYSSAPVSKRDLIRHFTSRFGLKTEISGIPASPNGERNIYASADRTAGRLLSYVPAYSSLKTLEEETCAALNGGIRNPSH